MKSNRTNYGYVFLLNLHNCMETNFSKQGVTEYFEEVSKIAELEKARVHWWFDYDNPEDNLAGLSAVQFIKGGSINVHALSKTKRVYIMLNCNQSIDSERLKNFTKKYFGSTTVVDCKTIERL